MDRLPVSDEDSASRGKNNKKTASVNKGNKSDKKKATSATQAKKTETKGSKSGSDKKNNKGKSPTNEMLLPV